MKEMSQSDIIILSLYLRGRLNAGEIVDILVEFGYKRRPRSVYTLISKLRREGFIKREGFILGKPSYVLTEKGRERGEVLARKRVDFP